MPRSQNPKKKITKKRKYNKRKQYRRYSKATKIARMPEVGFPDKVSVKLRYVERLDITTAGGVPYYNHIFRANSLYDPDYTGTGHQPLYFDQYAAIYDRYKVRGCKLVMVINNASGVNAMDVSAVHSTTTTPFTTTAKMVEQTDSLLTKFCPISQQYPVVLKYYVDCSEGFGITKAAYNNDSVYSAQIGTNPASVLYLHTHFESLNYTSSIAANVLVRLEFYVDFYDRNDIAQS